MEKKRDHKFPLFLLSWFSIPLHRRFPSGLAVHLVDPILSLPDSDLLQISWVPDLFNDRRPSCVVEPTVPASRTDSSCGGPAATEMNLDATRPASSGQAQSVPSIYLSGGGPETGGWRPGFS